MKTICILFLVVLSLSTSRSQTNTSDLIFWKKADIEAWHTYMPLRALTEERLTNEKAVDATESMLDGLESSLERILRYQTNELTAAELMVEGTNAQGCINGISDYIGKTIQQGINDYADCAADALPKLARLKSSWQNLKNNYMAAYQKSLLGIDKCAKTYPNKDSTNRLKICIESWTRYYFSATNYIRRDVLNSPSMRVFTTTVADCAESAAKEVVARGWTFLSMLVQCVKLSDVDVDTYEDQVKLGFYSYLTDNDLQSQIFTAQMSYIDIVSEVENKFIFYYNMQKDALEKYVVESRGQGHYYNQLYGYLSKYYQTVSGARDDNPGSADCSEEAVHALNSILSTASASALECDQAIVADAKRLIAEINDDFFAMNTILPSIGNAAILSCFENGYVFAQRTIVDCFKLTSAEFTVNVSDIYRGSIDSGLKTLQGYEQSFFQNSSLPCGDSILSKLYLSADKTLYDLQRCLYINSGSRYDVTVSPPPSIDWTTTAVYN